MTSEYLDQIMPVAASAVDWVTLSFSAGRLMSARPAITRPWGNYHKSHSEVQWNLWMKDTFGPAILSSVEKLSSSRRLKWTTAMGKGSRMAYFVRRLSLSRRVLYRRFHCTSVKLQDHWHGQTINFQLNSQAKINFHTCQYSVFPPLPTESWVLGYCWLIDCKIHNCKTNPFESGCPEMDCPGT